MAIGFGSMLGGLGGFFGEGAKFALFDTLFGWAREQMRGEAANKAATAIFERGSKWWGIDRSDDQLLAQLYVALHKHYEAEYDELRKALDVLWDKLLEKDHKHGKWAKRWRLTFVGIKWEGEPQIPSGKRKLKCKTPVINRKSGQPVLGPDDKPLYNEEYEDGTMPLAFSKEDPRLVHLYTIAKMAKEELASGEPGSENLPKTIHHLMVTYLQDDPFFKWMGEKWSAVITWLEGRNPLAQMDGLLWLTREERRRIQALVLDEAGKTRLRQEQSELAKELFESDLQEAKNEPFYAPFIRLWWLFALAAVILLIIMVMPEH